MRILLAAGPADFGATSVLLVGILGGFLLAGGIGLLLVALYVRRRSVRENPTDAPAERPDESEIAQARQDVRELMEELDQLADRIDTQIERRTAELKTLLTEVDTIVAENRPASNHAEISDTSYRPVESPVPSKATHTGPDATSCVDVSPQHEEIIRLKRQGLDPVEIARRVQMNTGEVELILNLHARS